MNMKEAGALHALMGAVERKALIGMLPDPSQAYSAANPVVTGEARYIGGRFTAERDHAAEARADVMDLYVIIRAYSPFGEYTDIPHRIADLIPMYLAGTLVVDYEVV